MKTDTVGLYVHIPFCVKKCAYCDFTSFSSAEFNKRTEYIESLCAEIRSYKNRNITADTIFFGGGTPSLLSCDEFRKLSSAIYNSFNVTPSVEFTVEVNPGTVDVDKLRTFAECGANRLSIGLQSIHDNELKKLGRIHDYCDFEKAFEFARNIGFANINIDVMYGIPDQTLLSLSKTLDVVTAKNPEHLSVYGLMLEPGTPLFASANNLKLPDEDAEADMYGLVAATLADKGYDHYEISNYAKPGYRCLHNLKYWNLDDYIGVGVSAHSCYGGKRFFNTSDPNVYISTIEEHYDHIGNGDPAEEPFEFVMLALRTSDGFSLRDYFDKFGCDFMLGRNDKINKFINAGYMQRKGERLRITEKGFYVSNAILAELL